MPATETTAPPLPHITNEPKISPARRNALRIQIFATGIPLIGFCVSMFRAWKDGVFAEVDNIMVMGLLGGCGLIVVGLFAFALRNWLVAEKAYKSNGE